jgi:hypothetical protein
VRVGVVVIVSIMLLMDTIVVGYDFGFKMGWPRAYRAAWLAASWPARAAARPSHPGRPSLLPPRHRFDARCSDCLPRLSTRLEPADAGRRRSHRPQAGRSTVCFPRLGPPAHSRSWTLLPVRHAHAAARRGLNAAPLPPAHPTACVGVLRRKPPRPVSSVLRGRRPLRAGRSSPARVASCAGAPAAACLTPCGLRPRFRSRGWGRAGPWAAPRPARLLPALQ